MKKVDTSGLINKLQEVTPKHLIIAFLGVILLSLIVNVLSDDKCTKDKALLCKGGKKVENVVSKTKELTGKAVDGVKSAGNEVVGLVSSDEEGKANSEDVEAKVAEKEEIEVTSTADAEEGSTSEEEVIVEEEVVVEEDTAAEKEDATADKPIQVQTKNDIVASAPASSSSSTGAHQKITTEIDVIVNFKTPDGQLLSRQPVTASAASAQDAAAATAKAEAEAKQNEIEQQISAKIDALKAEIEKLNELKESLAN